jgi:long-chain acyl-CoA synthetase
MTNLATNVTTTSVRVPDKVAVKLDDAVLTYAQLDQLSAKVAGWLRAQGISPGDSVGIMLPNVPAFPILYYGILRAGAVVVPMNPLLKQREVQHYLGDSRAKLAFVWQDVIAEAEPAATVVGSQAVPIGPDSIGEVTGWPILTDVVARADSDTAVLLYTSGTTGTAKGAELTHENIRRNVAVCEDLMGAASSSVIMGCLPLFHAFGQTCAMNLAVHTGATLTLIARFGPRSALNVIERDRVTIFQGVPTMYVAMLAMRDNTTDTSSLELCISGGAALPSEVLKCFAAKFGAEILEGYGLSETSPVASFNHPGDTRPGSIGKPIAGIEMKVVDAAGSEVTMGDVGEIVIRGHNVMKGYWNKPEATSEAIVDGWFHTGDLGKCDDDGFFFIVDRKKEMIVRGGFNIYPRELEEVLYEHPAVLEAAVVGIPDPTFGEEVAAAIALKPNASVTAGEIRDYMKAKVASYKYPRHVWLLDALPKGATGKILKRDIRIPEQL